MAFLTDLRQSPRLVTIVAFAAVALGITYGYDISNIAGALLLIEGDLGLNNAELGGLATAVVVGQIVGAIIGGPLSNAIGRKKSMFLIACGYIVFSIISGFAPATSPCSSPASSSAWPSASPWPSSRSSSPSPPRRRSAAACSSPTR